MPLFDVTDYGAIGDGRQKDTTAIQGAINACRRAGGGTVLLPAPGVYLAGSLTLCAHLELRIERGARLLSSAEEDDFPRRVFANGPETDKRIWISADGCDDIALTGGGVIDGNCGAFVVEDGPHIKKPLRWRPAMTCFIACRRVRVQDLTLVNAANWTLHFTGCQDVLVQGCTIDNPLDFPNCDGIDPDHCRDVRISDCLIRCADDCIVVKNTPTYAAFGPSERILVTNCNLVSTSCAIKIGSESVSDFRDMIFTNCTISDSNRGLGIQLRDEGNVEDLLFADMVIRTRLFAGNWWGAGEPIYVTSLPRTLQTRVGQVRGLRFRNLLCRGENGIYVQGCAASRPDDLAFEAIDLRIAKTSRWPAGFHDPRPCPPEIFPDREPASRVTPWGCRLHGRQAGIYLAEAGRIALRHIRLRFEGELPADYVHALEAHAVDGIEPCEVEGDAAQPGVEAVLID